MPMSIQIWWMLWLGSTEKKKKKREEGFLGFSERGKQEEGAGRVHSSGNVREKGVGPPHTVGGGCTVVREEEKGSR